MAKKVKAQEPSELELPTTVTNQPEETAETIVVGTPTVAVSPVEAVKMSEFIKPTVSEKPMEERIMEYIDSRTEGIIKLNDFLKSLFKLPKFNEPAEWAQVSSSKTLKVVLDKLVKENKIAIFEDRHLQLGKPYHEGDNQVSKNHNLNTVQIVAKKNNFADK